MALIDKIKAIADAIREKTGSTGLMNLDEMAEMITAMDSSGGVTTLDNTYILVDENGYEVPASFTEEVVDLTATTNDIRIGTTAVTDEGVVTGEKEIPAYYVSEGRKAIPNGSPIILYHSDYDYTKIQAVICAFNTNMSDSVAAKQVVIEDNIYPVNSTTTSGTLIKNSDDGCIDFGITNESGGIWILRYFMYKEMY